LQSIPSSVVTSSRPSDPPGPDRLPRGSPPLDGIPRISPVRDGSSVSVAVPLSGFLNPSAVSWHTRAPRPCFMPQPSLGFLPFEALLLVGVAHPSRDTLASLRLDHRASNRDRSAHGLSPRVSLTPTPLARRGGQLPAGAASIVSLARCRHRSSSPTLRTMCATTQSRRHRLRPLRSLHPPTKPHRGAAEAAFTAVAPLGFRLSRALLRSSLGPFDPMDRSVHRGLAPATTRDAIPRRQVRSRDLAAARPRRRARTRSYRARTRATSRRQPSLPRPWPSTRERASGVALGGVKDSISAPSSRDGVALLRFLTSSMSSRLRDPRRPWLIASPVSRAPRLRGPDPPTGRS